MVSERGKWDGVRAIAGFNWPYYLVAILVLVIGILAIGWFPVAGALVVSGCSYFLIGSLGVSHWIYDRSDLYQWLWLKRALNPVEGGKWLLCHSGFDEVSGMLIQKFPGAELRILDHYEPTTMTEASIQRARKLFPPTAGTLAARFDQWPVEDA